MTHAFPSRGSSDRFNSHALWDGCEWPTAQGERASAFGATASASGSLSTALGQDADASAAGAVALGQGSVADQANTVSVGTTTSQRRIVNLADGTAAADAVNLGQLDAAVGAIPVDSNNTGGRSEEHTSELPSLMRIPYAVFCLKKKNNKPQH